MNYLKFLCEGNIPSILYHASPTQGLKFLDPQKTMSTHLKTNKPYVYATDEKEYAAGFCFSWNSKEGFEYGDWGKTEEPAWTLKIPQKYKDRLKAPCSIYTMSGAGFRKVYGQTTPEFYKAGKVRLTNEEKYKTALDCLKKNKVIIKFI